MFPNLIKPAGFGGSAVTRSRVLSSTIAIGLGRSGMTPIVTAQDDDANINVLDIGFDFRLYGAIYRSNIFAGSNGYITFGFGSSAYSGLSRTNPGRGLLTTAADISWNYVSVKNDEPDSYRIRWEGSASSGGGTAVIREITLFADGAIQLALDTNTPVSGINTLTKGDGVTYTDYTPNANTSANSLVFLPTDSAGNSHTVQYGSYV